MEGCHNPTDTKVHYQHVWKGATSLPIQGFNNQLYIHLYKNMMHNTYQLEVYIILKNPSYSNQDS